MDKASDYGSGDSRFESWQGRFLPIFFFFFPSLFFALQLLLLHTYQDTCPSLFKIRKKLKWVKITYRGSFQYKPHPSGNFAEKRVTSRAVFESFLGYKELKLTTKRATKLLAGRTFRSLLIYRDLYVWVHVQNTRIFPCIQLAKFGHVQKAKWAQQYWLLSSPLLAFLA